MIENKEARKDFFKATVCPTCGFCKDPQPGLCLVLYDADAIKFLEEIVKKIKILRTTGFDISAFADFEGFVALFCRPERCPLYDDNCKNLITTQGACYTNFISQAGITKNFAELSNIYSKWSGIETKRLSNRFDFIDRSLSKQERKKVKKALKKLKKSARKVYKTVAVGNTKKSHKKVTTNLFCNSGSEWKEKISTYLGENEQPKSNNRQQNKAHKCA